MRNQGAFKLNSAYAVSCHFEDFVCSAEEPEVAFWVLNCVVACVVDVGPSSEVGLLASFGVFPQGLQHSRPWRFNYEEAFVSCLCGLSLFVVDFCLNAGQRMCC